MSSSSTATTTLPLCTNKSLCSSFTNNSSFLSKPSQLFLHGRRNRSFKVSSNANNNVGGHDKNLDAVDRRNVLLGLGGLYGAANLAPIASASPIPPPDLKSFCCPPVPDDMDSVPYYKFPPMTKLRIRPPAHAADEEYVAKYQLATSRMKELDKDSFDPLGFKQQANIHCAYCNGAYKVGGKELQVHFSWLFFPFHRWYLYFYERILGSLINDPTFALPYWNWDHPKGMRIPPMFDREGSSLYDDKRNQNHRNGTIIDLGHFGTEVDTPQLQIMTNNLTLMYRQMVTNAPCPSQFFGAAYPLGTEPKPGMGTIENIPHTPVHIWTGDPRQDNGENMGNFYSAGLDPLFYCHHANVDRMWDEWKLIGGKRRDLSNKDWLNSEFFFYDENRNPYRVKVRDCLDSKKMGFSYAPMPTPWRNFKPIRKTSAGKLNTASIAPVTKVFPLAKLDRAITFSITRPASSRTTQEKNEQEEILTFEDVAYDDTQYVRFDVFLNVDKTVNADELDKAEFAGSYTSLPHVHVSNSKDHDKKNTKVIFKLAITELLEDIGLEDEDTIAVTLVPKVGGEGVSIQSVEIKLEDC
ncbi:hypothetical protein R3W88_021041 [Solanum pinnatisectum]|uniref:catechol oxidase n=1 Tax=Solanum pinnatisectum TaxID=50273 RepID=A0AAV9LRL5_9SOLN|nr:hypothetical protein R3W88_021041 [Solanum pinnatisectum]